VRGGGRGDGHHGLALKSMCPFKTEDTEGTERS